jgi:hypothetical protein
MLSLAIAYLDFIAFWIVGSGDPPLIPEEFLAGLHHLLDDRSLLSLNYV